VAKANGTSGTPRGNLPPLSLHVPEPPFRPGDPVDYSFLRIPPPGGPPKRAGRRKPTRFATI
jgi:2-oxoisovalerate dehydrogenase E1 component alpha subunit